MTIFILKYSHRDSLNGWYDIAAYKTREEAEQALEIEKKDYPDYLHTIDTCELY